MGTYLRVPFTTHSRMQSLVEVTGLHDLSTVAIPPRDDNANDKISSVYVCTIEKNIGMPETRF